jgi:hypothetical protein
MASSGQDFLGENFGDDASSDELSMTETGAGTGCSQPGLSCSDNGFNLTTNTGFSNDADGGIRRRPV